jgi:hypothetical protein
LTGKARTNTSQEKMADFSKIFNFIEEARVGKTAKLLTLLQVSL